MNYHLGLIFVLILGAYLFTMKLPHHRMIWNVILLISFLMSGILGLMLAAGILTSNYQLVLWVHVETGIVMALVSMLHIARHLKYFKFF